MTDTHDNPYAPPAAIQEEELERIPLEKLPTENMILFMEKIKKAKEMPALYAMDKSAVYIVERFSPFLSLGYSYFARSYPLSDVDLVVIRRGPYWKKASEWVFGGLILLLLFPFFALSLENSEKNSLPIIVVAVVLAAIGGAGIIEAWRTPREVRIEFQIQRLSYEQTIPFKKWKHYRAALLAALKSQHVLISLQAEKLAA